MSPRLFVRPLPRDVRESELEDFFKTFGQIADIKPMSGYAFVEFAEQADADAALKEGAGQRFLGEFLVIEYAKPRGEPRERRSGPPRVATHRLILSNIPDDATWQDVKDFVRSGDVDPTYTDVSRSRDGTGVVDVCSKEDVDRALDLFKDKDLRGARVSAEEDPRGAPPPPARPESRGRDRGFGDRGFGGRDGGRDGGRGGDRGFGGRDGGRGSDRGFGGRDGGRDRGFGDRGDRGFERGPPRDRFDDRGDRGDRSFERGPPRDRRSSFEERDRGFGRRPSFGDRREPPRDAPREDRFSRDGPREAPREAPRDARSPPRGGDDRYGRRDDRRSSYGRRDERARSRSPSRSYRDSPRDAAPRDEEPSW